MTRILIADDHALIREGLKQILGMADGLSVGGEAANGAEVITQLRRERWDVLLLDMSMPGRSGIELIKQIKEEFPKVPILVLTMHGEQQYAVRVLKAGAAGYLTKESAPTELVAAVRKVAAGGAYMSLAIAEKIALDFRSSNSDESPHRQLSDREFAVFLQLAEGRSISEIADQLCVSAKTVSTYKARVFQKLQLQNQTELVQYAIRHHFLNDDGEPAN